MCLFRFYLYLSVFQSCRLTSKAVEFTNFNSDLPDRSRDRLQLFNNGLCHSKCNYLIILMMLNVVSLYSCRTVLVNLSRFNIFTIL